MYSVIRMTTLQCIGRPNEQPTDRPFTDQTVDHANYAFLWQLRHPRNISTHSSYSSSSSPISAFFDRRAARHKWKHCGKRDTISTLPQWHGHFVVHVPLHGNYCNYHHHHQHHFFVVSHPPPLAIIQTSQACSWMTSRSSFVFLQSQVRDDVQR